MDNPGAKQLFVGAISTALDRSTGAQTPIEDLSGLTALSLDFDFRYGSSGATCSAVVQTGPSSDTSKWRDIARVDFTTASAVKQCNLEGLLSKAVGAYADLAAEGVNDGILYDRLRVVLIVTGTYANTTLAVHAGCR